MGTLDSSLTDRERRLDEAAAEYFAARAAGLVPDRQQWLAQYPDLAEDLGEFLADLDGVQQAITPLRPDAVDAKYLRDATLFRGLLGSAAAPTAAPPAERYCPRQLHARGGMGEIWLADDAQIGRRVALKRLRVEQREAHDRFVTEARITGQLEHPSIVPLHDLAAGADGKPFYVMKFVEGRSLREVIAAYHAAGLAQDWPHDVEFVRLLAAFVSICRAVAYAHSRGVIHRDIKPDNIMLGSFGESLLLDWGLAKVSGQQSALANDPSPTLTSPASDSARTQVGVIMGSPAYMSPELADGHANAADPRTDVYLLGATLYEMLTGCAPRVGSSQLDVLRLARTTDPLAPRKANDRIPRPLEAICLKAMARVPDDRYPSAGALAEDVERYLAGEPVTVYRESLPARAWRWIRRHQRNIRRGVMAALALVLAAIAAALFWHAQSLVRRERARHQLAEFRSKSDEARFLAASTDPVSELAPYYDPRRAVEIGETALRIAESWGPRGRGLANVPEQAGWEGELYDLLLVLAGAECEAGSQPQGSQRAWLLLDRAAAVHPATRGYHRLRARCLTRLGATDDAQREAALADDPRLPFTAQDHFLRGELLRTASVTTEWPRSVQTTEGQKRERISQALDEYREALRIDPQHYWAQFQLGRSLLSLGRGPEAVQALGACIALRPSVPWAYSARGLAYGLLGQYSDAHRDLELAIQLDPDFRPAKLNRGFVLLLQNRFDAAMADFDAVLQPPAERRLIEAAYYRAQIHLQRQAESLAEEDCSAVITHRPGFRPAYWLRAQIDFRTGQDARGTADIHSYLRLAGPPAWDAHSAEACYARGRALRDLATELEAPARNRVLTLALAELEAAMARGLPAQDVQLEVGALADLLGQVQTAIANYSQQLESAPDNLQLRNQRGWAYVSAGQYDDATDDFREVLRRSPQNAEAYTGLGFILASRGECSESERAATMALLHGGDNYLVLHNVACIYAELSRTQADQTEECESLALAALERAVARYRQNPQGPNEIALIRQEPAFPSSLRLRPEFQKLLAD